MSAILSRIASLHHPYNKTTALDLIRRARKDGLSLPAGRQPELAAALLAESERQAKIRKRRLAPLVMDASRPRSLKDRLAAWKAARDARICDLVRATRKGLYRVASDAGKYAPTSGHTTTVKIGDRASVSSDSARVWGKKYAATSSSHAFTVRRDWVERVYDRDLEKVDGMLTLDAEPVQGVGAELFRATWVEQGRGTALNQVSGYIARLDGTTYHAPSGRAALDGVQRKAGLKPARRQGVVDLDKLARRHGDLPVHFADARAVGACESGTVSWCYAVGVDPYGTATLADVVRGYKLRPMAEALAVLRHVVRDRHNRQPLDLATLNGAAPFVAGDGRIVFDAEGGFRILPPTDGASQN